MSMSLEETEAGIWKPSVTHSSHFSKEICTFFYDPHSAHSCELHIQPHKDLLNSWLVQVPNSPKWKWAWLCVCHMCTPYPINCVLGGGNIPLWKRGISKCWRTGQVFITRSIAQEERCALEWIASGTGPGYKTWLQAKRGFHLTSRPPPPPLGLIAGLQPDATSGCVMQKV